MQAPRRGKAGKIERHNMWTGRLSILAFSLLILMFMGIGSSSIPPESYEQSQGYTSSQVEQRVSSNQEPKDYGESIPQPSSNSNLLILERKEVSVPETEPLAAEEPVAAQAAPAAAEAAKNATTEPAKTPGFESVFAIIGLIATACMIFRLRKSD
jgi:hypothetical protein